MSDSPVVLRAPRSKSDAIRKLLVAASSPRPTRVRGLPEADDVVAVRRALRELVAANPGATDDEELLAAGEASTAEVECDLGGSATGLRLVSVVAARSGRRVRLRGDPSLRARPVGGVVPLLRALGAEVSTEDGRPPLVVRGPLTLPSSARIEVDASESSHPLSAALLAAAAFPRETRVEATGAVVSEPYVQWTAEVLRSAGARVEGAGATWRVEGPLQAVDGEVVGDWSGASYLLAAGAALGVPVDVQGLEWGTPQADRRVLELLRAMGAETERRPDGVVVRGHLERGVSVELGDAPDLAPLVGALGCLVDSPTEVRGAAHLRTKESDRIARVVELARALGCRGEEREDGFLVQGPVRRPAVLPGHGDHRLVMAFSLIGRVHDRVRVTGLGAVRKSFPDFHAALDAVGRT